MMIRTRIAPSPTGFAHVGTAYTAIFNYAYARKGKGKLVLRLEDTDVKRKVKGAEEAVYAGLSWLGITWDEGPDKGGKFGPYRQSERLEIYKKKADALVRSGDAFEDEGAIRFKNSGSDMEWTDKVRGKISFPGGEVRDFVIMKSDGYPTYNFAVVVDDIEMKITHVIRGEEHISNTPRQLALYKAFGVQPPEFAHLPTLRNAEHKKLSKRGDAVDLGAFRKEGYLPEALVNFLCLLGWSHPDEKEVFGLDEFIKHLSLDRIKKAGPIFDIKKLDWLNGIYIRNKDNKDLAHLVNEHVTNDVSGTSVEEVAPLIKDRVNKLSEANDLLEFFWSAPQVGKELFGDESPRHLASAARVLGEIKNWNLGQVNKKFAGEIKKKKFKTGDFYMSLRIALSGKKITPPINESIVILGQDKVLHRLEEAQKALLEMQPAD
ncbi:glutamate--tRNA ligase [Candidatus Woesebacteria bacterium]|nr:glutamate--tRNA ligase [Candidatus Woesebacteria bacterium]